MKTTAYSHYCCMPQDYFDLIHLADQFEVEIENHKYFNGNLKAGRKSKPFEDLNKHVSDHNAYNKGQPEADTVSCYRFLVSF